MQKLSRGQSRPAEILSAGIKPLPALAALSKKKKKKEKSARNKTKTNQPKKQLLSVTFSLALLFLACVCVCEKHLSRLTGCFTRSLVQGLQPQPSKPSSGASPNWSLLQGACHHLSHLPKEKGCPVCPEPIQLEEFVNQSADGVSRFTLK